MKHHADQDNFGKNLIILRKLHGLTQKQMAQIMGCSLYCLRKAERGIFTQTLYVESIEKLCRNFSIKPSALFDTPPLVKEKH